MQTPQRVVGQNSMSAKTFENCVYTFLQRIHLLSVLDNILSVEETRGLPVVADNGGARGHIEQDRHHQSWHEVGRGAGRAHHHTVTRGQGKTGLDLAENIRELILDEK